MRQKTAVSLILLGAFFMSFNGLLIRLLEAANGFQILFYRSISMSVLVLIVIIFRRRVSIKKIVEQIDRWDLLIGTFLGVAFSSYVFSIIFTSVAATLFILSTAPLLATFFAWIFLGERPSIIVVVAMSLSLFGVFLMVSEGLSMGKNLGNFLAFLAAVSFASMLVATRGSNKIDVLTGTLLGGMLSGALGLLGAIYLSNDIYLSSHDIFLILLMGAFAIGLGITLVTIAAPFVPSSEVSVLVLLESFLGPVWVWLLIGEDMSGVELVGGFIIFGSVFLLSQNSKNENH